MQLEKLIPVFGLAVLVLTAGCYPGAPRTRIPGVYEFQRAGYTTHLQLNPDGTATQKRIDPSGREEVQSTYWRVGPLGGHITVDEVLAFYPEAGVDMHNLSFFTPEVDILWFRVCLLVDGNKDLYMCKE